MRSGADLRRVKVVILDIDGVMTDGRVGYGAGEVIKFFHVRDCHWLKLARRVGIKLAVITGRSDRATRDRMADIGLDFFREGVHNKPDEFQNLLAELQVTPEECMYIGDDVVDLPVMRRCGVGVVVGDGLAELEEGAHFRTKAPGGNGAVREAVCMLLKAQDKLNAALERYYK